MAFRPEAGIFLPVALATGIRAESIQPGGRQIRNVSPSGLSKSSHSGPGSHDPGSSCSALRAKSYLRGWRLGRRPAYACRWREPPEYEQNRFSPQGDRFELCRPPGLVNLRTQVRGLTTPAVLVPPPGLRALRPSDSTVKRYGLACVVWAGTA